MKQTGYETETTYEGSKTLDENNSETLQDEFYAKRYASSKEAQSAVEDYEDEDDFFPYENHPHIYRPTYTDMIISVRR